MATSLYDHLYSTSLSVHEVSCTSWAGQYRFRSPQNDLATKRCWCKIWQISTMSPMSPWLEPFFIKAYLWGAWNTESVMMWFNPWCEWEMRTGNDDVITRKIGWQVGANWHSTRYISITADISTKYLVYNCSVALTTQRIYARHWLPDWQSFYSTDFNFLLGSTRLIKRRLSW